MPELELPIQGYTEPQQPSMYELPVAAPVPAEIPRVVINTTPEHKLKEVEHDPWETGKKVIDKLFGLNGQERYQLWPEKLIRSGVSAAGDALAGNIPQYQVDPVTGDVHTSPQMIERAMDMSAVAGTGGLAGTGGEGAALGSGPMLRPALKYKDKIYKAPVGGQHLDALPPSLYEEFNKMAMSGEDISHYNFGFMNHKGQFLDREKALDYAVKEGLVDPTAGQYGALTSTLLADSSKPGVAIEAMAKAEPFYSALEHNVKNINQQKMNGDAWLGTLANKPGVKLEELQWTGLKDFLEENKGKPVTKAQIEEHLAANKVELKEVRKADKHAIDPTVKYLYESMGPATKHLTDAASIADARKFNSAFRETTKGMSDEEVLAAARASEKLEGLGDTKYHSYQLPGGENYREMLLTLPNKQFRTYEWEYFDPKTQQSKQFKTEAEAKAAAPEGAVVVPKETAEYNTAYRSSHWDEPNILAHVRMNDRTIDGKKSLHLEEIQSDWHQQGRDKGYQQTKAGEAYDAYLADLKNRIKDDTLKVAKEHGIADDRAQFLASEALRKMQPHEMAKYFDEVPKMKELWDAKIAGEKGVPDAPFKKSWHELALKRMIREAAEKGYDRLSWTPGEAQAARYDLSEQVNLVSGMKQGDKYNVYIEGKDGHALYRNQNGFSEHGQKTMTEQELKDTIGKEAAEKIINGKPNKEGWVDLRDNNLKIGGEGMKGFYDQIIPKALSKISGQKVKQSIDPNAGEKFTFMNKKSGNKGQEFKSQEEANAWLKESGIDPDSVTLLQVNRRAKEGSKFEPVHYIDLPQSLKDTAMHKGFPLFSSTHMFIPVDHDPFEKLK